MKAADFKKWIAIGTGIGIEIGRDSLTVTVVRSRPAGVRVLGELTVPRFHEQPASEWGATYAAFLKKLGVGHLSAGVLLPRDEVIVRQVMLPGVSDKDLAAAFAMGIGIDQRHGDIGHAERFAVASSCEDHVFHARAAQALGRLLAEHPRDGVGNVRLAAAVRSDDGGDALPVKLEFGAVTERLEAENLKFLQFEQRELLEAVARCCFGAMERLLTRKIPLPGDSMHAVSFSPWAGWGGHKFELL